MEPRWSIFTGDMGHNRKTISLPVQPLQVPSGINTQSTSSSGNATNDEETVKTNTTDGNAMGGISSDCTAHFRTLFLKGHDANTKFDPATVLDILINLPDQYLPTVNGRKKRLPVSYKMKKMNPNQSKCVETYWNELAKSIKVEVAGQPDRLVLVQPLVMEQAIKHAASKQISLTADITKNDKVSD